MPTSLITGPSFPALEQRLLTDLLAVRNDDPLEPKWVVVPSATLTNHLRLRLAQSAADRPIAGVRVIRAQECAIADAGNRSG